MMLFLTTLLLFITPASAPVHDGGPKAVNRAVLLETVNALRRSGLQCGNVYYPPVAPLVWNSQLEQASQLHSIDMEEQAYFSHVAPDGSRAGARLDRIGYAWRAYGENIGKGYDREKEVVTAWVKSPAHCRNIMSPLYKEMGVARSGKYWTQTFGAR